MVIITVHCCSLYSYGASSGAPTKPNIITVHCCSLYSYGASSGAPTEPNIYADVDAAWRCMTERYGISAERVILYGQSIGTVPTVDLASRVKVAGVVLHSPLTSGVRVAFPDTKQTWFFDAFPRLINKLLTIVAVFCCD